MFALFDLMFIRLFILVLILIIFFLFSFLSLICFLFFIFLFFILIFVFFSFLIISLMLVHFNHNLFKLFLLGQCNVTFGFKFSVESLLHLYLCQDWHRVISYVQHIFFFLYATHITCFFNLTLFKVLVQFPLYHLIKILVNTLNISIEIKISIRMVYRYTLWKINYS